MAHQINGYHCKGGYHTEGRGCYLVEIVGGRLYDTDSSAWGDEVYVRQYGDDAPILTNGCWEFWPDDSDLARLGIVPTQMIAA